MSKNGVTFEVQQDGGVNIYGTATESVGFFLSMLDYGNDSIFNNGKGNGKILSGGKNGVEIEYHGTNKRLYLTIAKGKTVNTVIYPQLQNGSTATPYEPYTGGQPSPSPEYPQQIKNVGKYNEDTGKYEVDVKISNKNLFDLKKIKKGFVTSTGNGFNIMEDNRYTKSIYLDMVIPLKTGQTLNISGAEQDACRIRVKHDTGNYYLKYTANKDTEIIICFYDGLTDENKKNILIEISDTPTNYEPYKEQTLTLTSDRPITKWDKLVEQDGQIGWLYGGKIIESYNSEPIDTEYISSTGELSAGATVLYKLKEAEFVLLPQSEQDAIRALKTYYPTTVITVDGGEVSTDIEVSYTADTKNYIDQKIAAINKTVVETQKALL